MGCITGRTILLGVGDVRNDSKKKKKKKKVLGLDKSIVYTNLKPSGYKMTSGN